MKNIITLILIVASTISFAQKKYKKADGLFDKMRYIEAAKVYEKAIDKGDNSIEVLQKAGDAYYFNTDMEGANKWYDLLMTQYLEQVNPEYIFRFAHSLEGIGEHKQAKKWMKLFAKRSNQKDTRADKYAQNNITIDDVLNIQPQFTLKNLSINTENSDFGPMYYGNNLVYSSAVDSSYFHTRTYNWNEQPFLSFQTGRINASHSDVEYIESFSEEINTKYHEATLAFSPDETKVYFTRNNFNGKLGRDGEGINHLKLYSADLKTSVDDEKEKREWQNIKELPFNSEDYSVGHPSVSEDGSKLYFVSDMPGSIGATDIYVVDILNNNEYSKPKNLGPKINTAGREMFPYITNQKLYFASDGHLGLGGLDVFESISGNVFENPVNLGAPLNSKLDDFAYIVKEDANLGFVCSNRDGGMGDDDIYSFDRNPIENKVVEELCNPIVTGFISNEITGERIANVTVKLFDESGKELETTQTNLNGNYNFNGDLNCDTRYDVKVSKVGYLPSEKPFISNKKETIVPLGLKILNEGIYEDRGLVKIKIGIIYFDLDKSFIRNDASIELNKVVLLMNQYPKMVINIESHTDSRSPDNYNLDLSDRRAKEARDYIISNGISAERILSAIGYGETKLVNKCKNGVPCAEEQHQLNRRSEFIIVRM